MKKSLLSLLVFFIGCTPQKKDQTPELIIYAYQSFASEWGIGPVVLPLFEKECRCRVKLVSAGDTGAMLNRLILEGKNTRADVIIGIDNHFAGKALARGILQPYQPKNISVIPSELLFEKSDHLIPFDFGYFAFVYDSEKTKVPPKKFSDLAHALYRKKIILEDPRTSTPGLGFLLWTAALKGEKMKEFWKALKPNILAIAPGWDMAYGMFTKGEAPFVFSYSTSPAYHLHHEKNDRYKAALFEEGHMMQIEGLGISAYTKNLSLARAFVEFALSLPFQREIPLRNFMYPANKNTPLPAVFENLPRPKALSTIDSATLETHLESWLKTWRESFQ